MNVRLSLARKVLKANIEDKSFTCILRASENGTCGGGWCDDVDVVLSKAELLYLLKCKLNNDELFKGMNIKQFDLDDALAQEAYSSSWDDKDSTARANDVLPYELKDLARYLISEECNIEEAHKRILEIKDGKYSFECTVVQNDYLIGEHEDVEINLTAEEAIKLLYTYLYDYDDVDDWFENICSDTMYAEELEDRLTKAVQGDDDIDPFSYSGESDSLNSFIDGWAYIVSNILNGNIQSKDIDKWTPYFDDNNNLDEDIERWYNDNYNN